MNIPKHTSDSWMSRLWNNKIEIVLSLILGSIIYILMFTKLADNPKVDLDELTRLQLEQSKTVLNDFKAVCGRYPTTSESLIALFEKPTSLKCERYPQEGFVRDLPSNRKATFIDPWEQPYKYTSDGNSFRIESSHGVFVQGP